MDKILAKIDQYIEKIPEHIRDIIKKGYLAFLGLGAVIAVLYGISEGEKDAKPAGMPLASEVKDLFYLDQLRHENLNRMKLVEDIEVDPMHFPSNQREIGYMPMGKDTLGHLMGEKDSVLESDEKLRLKDPSAEYLDEVPIFNKSVPKDTMLIHESETKEWSYLEEKLKEKDSKKKEDKLDNNESLSESKENIKKEKPVLTDNNSKSILDFLD